MRLMKRFGVVKIRLFKVDMIALAQVEADSAGRQSRRHLVLHVRVRPLEYELVFRIQRLLARAEQFYFHSTAVHVRVDIVRKRAMNAPSHQYVMRFELFFRRQIPIRILLSIPNKLNLPLFKLVTIRNVHLPYFFCP